MNKMLLVSEVAGLAKKIERSFETGRLDKFTNSTHDGLRSMALSLDAEDQSSKRSLDMEKIFGADGDESLPDDLNMSERIRVHQLLDEWEEPELDRPEVRKC